MQLIDENNRPFDSIMLKIDGNDYKAWSEDDSFVVNYVRDKLQEIYEKEITIKVVDRMKSYKKCQNNP